MIALNRLHTWQRMGLIALFAWATPSLAGPAGAELGRQAYEGHCATCHGLSAQGDGPMRPFLVLPPADLTQLARRYNGRFPRQAVAELIDGRALTDASVHGSRDMPVWGTIFLDASRRETAGTPFPAEWSVRGRIMALVEYLATLQQP